jgi:uncharacterized protein (DUF58 family)
MDTKELLKKVKKIEIKTKQISNHLFSGQYHTSFKGKGMAFSEVRPYQYGDDYRNIDWNVTAKNNDTFIKVFEEERELTMLLMVDCSQSQMFGTLQQNKKEYLTEIAATLAFAASKNNDKVGLILFTDTVELYVPPKKGKSHILRIIREILEIQPKSNHTNINNALTFLSNISHKKAIVFLLSDFICEDFTKTLQIASTKHDITTIRVFDNKEQTLPNMGLLQLQDLETNQTMWVNTQKKDQRDAYNLFYDQKIKHYKSICQKSGVGIVETATEDNYAKKLMAYFKTRN